MLEARVAGSGRAAAAATEPRPSASFTRRMRRTASSMREMGSWPVSTASRSACSCAARGAPDQATSRRRRRRSFRPRVRFFRARGRRLFLVLVRPRPHSRGPGGAGGLRLLAELRRSAKQLLLAARRVVSVLKLERSEGTTLQHFPTFCQRTKSEYRVKVNMCRVTSIIGRVTAQHNKEGVGSSPPRPPRPRPPHAPSPPPSSPGAPGSYSPPSARSAPRG